MKVTYIGHSGFMVSIDDIYMIFDYYVGNIPVLPENSRVYVFVSHRHEDHFNPAIFKLAEKYDVTYILSYDIKLNTFGIKKYGIPENIIGRIISIRYDEQKLIDGLCINAFKSTDTGVAYLVTFNGKNIYHAGDHNWWHWIGESKQYNNNMAANYKKGIAQLIKVQNHMNVSMVPLDSRLEEAYYYGMKYFLENAASDVVFPMHFSEDYECRNRFVNTYGYGDRLYNIEHKGQEFEV